MARISSKTNWTAADTPLPSDINRIENNNEQAFTDIDAETAARIADVNAEEAARIAYVDAETAARIADVNAEESARISADSTLQSNIDTANSLRASGDSTLQTNINSANSARINADNALDAAKLNNASLGSVTGVVTSLFTSGISVLSAGTYAILPFSAAVLEILDSTGSWFSFAVGEGYPLVISNGTNVRIRNTSSTSVSGYRSIKFN